MTYNELNTRFHRIDIILGFEMWENNSGDECIIVVDKEQNTYMYSYDDFRTIIYNANDYIWYKFKE